MLPRFLIALLMSLPLFSFWVLVASTRLVPVDGFTARTTHTDTFVRSPPLRMTQISQSEAQRAINIVVATLRKNPAANKELGKLGKVTVVLGFGSPANDIIAVRFNASFKKSGFGLSLGRTNESEGRGTMVGQVKASVDMTTKKVKTCSVFRDLGYGRSFELEC